MKNIFISGLLNVETSLKVNSFPIEYNPIEYPFFGVSSSVSGVGYNIAKALNKLGDNVTLSSIIGDDSNGNIIRYQLNEDKISTNHLKINAGMQTPESVVLFDQDGKRKIYCDLKNIQDLTIDELAIKPEEFDLAILTNINFSRKAIKLFKDAGVLVASDVHVLTNIEDDYNKDFLENADILFLSNEGVIGREADFIKEIYNRYRNKIIVIGCGAEGALAYVGDNNQYFYHEAVSPLEVVNTVGAGDALFSAFLHYYLISKDVEKSLKFAVYFAGIKIATSGGANGFVSEEDVLMYMK